MKPGIGAAAVGDEVTDDVTVVERAISVFCMSLRLVLLFSLRKHRPRCWKKNEQVQVEIHDRVLSGSKWFVSGVCLSKGAQQTAGEGGGFAMRRDLAERFRGKYPGLLKAHDSYWVAGARRPDFGRFEVGPRPKRPGIGVTHRAAKLLYSTQVLRCKEKAKP